MNQVETINFFTNLTCLIFLSTRWIALRGLINQHVIGVQAGQPVKILNSDGTLHEERSGHRQSLVRTP